MHSYNGCDWVSAEIDAIELNAFAYTSNDNIKMHVRVNNESKVQKRTRLEVHARSADHDPLHSFILQTTHLAWFGWRCCWTPLRLLGIECCWPSAVERGSESCLILDRPPLHSLTPRTHSSSPRPEPETVRAQTGTRDEQVRLLSKL